MKFKKLIILLVIVSIFTIACTKEIESESVEIESSQRETDVASDDLKEVEEDTVYEDVEMVESETDLPVEKESKEDLGVTEKVPTEEPKESNNSEIEATEENTQNEVIKDENIEKAISILTSNDLVKSLEYDGAKYVESYDGNLELDGKSLNRIDYIEDLPSHVNTSQRYAVDTDSGEIYINDIITNEWMLIEDYVTKNPTTN